LAAVTTVHRPTTTIRLATTPATIRLPSSSRAKQPERVFAL
jgi:hypothetical protein